MFRRSPLIAIFILFLLTACSGDNDSPYTNALADQDGDGIVDILDSDRDGDGVNNAQDSWPDDATRSSLPAVSGLQARLQLNIAQLQWQALSGDLSTTELLAGYNLYRNTTDNTNWVKLNNTLISDINYSDNNLLAGVGYRYKVVAVDKNAIEGQSSAAIELFAAFNTTLIQDFIASVQGISVQLDWQAISGVQYQVYRSLNGAAPTLLTTLSNNQYIDNNIVNQQSASYQVASLVTYNNSFSGEQVQVRGFLSPLRTVVLPIITELTFSINNATTAADGVQEIIALQGNRARVTGQYSGAPGDVTVTASTTINNQPVSINQITSSGQFDLELPASQLLTWQITVSDNVINNRKITGQLRILSDTTPPVISIDGAGVQNINANKITLTGNVSDTGSGIQTVILQSTRFNGVNFTASITAQRFNVEIPLQVGSNIITATATDLLGNATQVSITVNRKIAAAPRIEITSPQTGSTTNNNKLNITGIIYSSQASEDLRIDFQNQQIFPTATAQQGVHSFSFNNINLQSGVNTLSVRVDSPQGSDLTQLQITYNQQAINQQSELPVINVLSPAESTVTADNSIIIRGNANGAAGILRIRVNGITVATGSVAQTTLNFQYSLDLSALTDGAQQIRIEANDGAGKTVSRRFRIIKDTQAPKISLNNSGLLLSPQVNTVRSNPYTLSGIITDTNIAGFTINGQSVKLLPGVAADTYTFDTPLALPTQQNQTLTLNAWDQAGQQTQQALILFSDVRVNIDIVSPINNAEIQLPFAGQGASYSLDITARLTGWLSSYQVSVTHEQDAPQTMSVVSGTARQTLQIPLTEGNHTLTIQVTDSAGELLSQASTTVKLINAAQIPLQLISSTPANESTTAEPHLPITLFFNRPIDRSKIQLNVYETFSGLNYDLKALEGKSALENQQVELINIDRSHEAVPGGLSFFPEDTLITFYPDREFAYAASVFVNVIYNNQPLAQLSFNIRPLPTFVQGTVVASDQIPLAGIEVSIPELGRSTLTSDNGNFGFGFGDSANNTLPAGRYKMIVNPGLKDRRYGIQERWLNIEKGRITKLPASQLQVLYANTPFNRISSGSTASLFEGELKIDLSQATLYFPDGRKQGDIHVQLIEYGQLPYGSLNAAIPHWMYGIQPMGIKVNGPVNLDITMPSLNNSYDYTPPEGSLVVLLGYNSDAQLLMPVGVGHIQNRHVISQQTVQLDELSYLGYALALPAQQPLLQSYVDGSITLDELIAGLNP